MGRPKLYTFKICPVCNKEFDTRLPCGQSYSRKKWCSVVCTQRGKPRKRGYHFTYEHREKIRQSQLGSKGNNWRGGEWSSQPQSERKSARYRTIRKNVFERDNYTCVLCKRVGGSLELDHIKSYSKHQELRLEPNNLRTLCKECHRKTPTFARG
jgi:5-methylcytosine-specific restriction endonuclease McrA